MCMLVEQVEMRMGMFGIEVKVSRRVEAIYIRCPRLLCSSEMGVTECRRIFLCGLKANGAGEVGNQSGEVRDETREGGRDVRRMRRWWANRFDWFEWRPPERRILHQ